LATAYVLINCELGAEEFVISELNSIDGTWKIRKIPKIRSTLTLMGIDGQG